MESKEQVNQERDSKKIIAMIVLIATLMVCTTSATYAYLAFTATNNVMTGTVAASGLTLTVTKATQKTSNTGVMVPQLESALGTAMNSTNQCVDGNGNIVCNVYTITVSTTSTATTPTTGTITFTNPSANLKWKLVNNATTVGSNGTATKATTSAATFATPTFTAANKSFTYYIVVWINETGAVQTDSGTWRATIAFNNENGGITSTIRS